MEPISRDCYNCKNYKTCWLRIESSKLANGGGGIGLLSKPSLKEALYKCIAEYCGYYEEVMK